MSTKEQEIKRLIELKRLQEELQVLDQITMQEKMKLDMKYKKYLSLSSEEMEEQLNNLPVQTSVKGESLDAILGDYKKLYSGESWYQEPKMEDGTLTLSFPTQQDAVNFYLDQSEKNREFVVVNIKTNKVVAYSNGDGKLYHGDGRAFQQGDTLSPCGVDFDSFNMPEREHQSSMSLA